jgi:hypothetical protein
MEGRQACSLFQITSVAFWYTVALFKTTFESNKPPYALKMLGLPATSKSRQNGQYAGHPLSKNGFRDVLSNV